MSKKEIMPSCKFVSFTLLMKSKELCTEKPLCKSSNFFVQHLDKLYVGAPVANTLDHRLFRVCDFLEIGFIMQLFYHFWQWVPLGIRC